MNYLLDTCVISELISKLPNSKVVRWIDDADPISIHLSALSVGEIRKGIEKVGDNVRKQILEKWLQDHLLVRFNERILAVDTDVAMVWGSLIGRLDLKGRKMPAIDSLIAATALFSNLTLVTRNEDDFQHAGVTIVNPWK